MKRLGLAMAAGCIAVLACGGLAVYSEEQKMDSKSPEFRAKFLKELKTTSLSTTAGDAMLLRILIESRGAKRGVEIGTAYGFGAMNMGIAFERTGGRLTTIDIDPKMVKTARENIAKVGLQDTVTCVEGDALKVLAGLEGEVDFAFLDARKEDYFKYFKLLQPRLKPGAIVVADNVIQSAGAMRDFLDFLNSSPDWDVVTIRASMDKNDGMLVCYRIR